MSSIKYRKGDHRMIGFNKTHTVGKALRRTMALVLALLLFCTGTVSAASLTTMDEVPYYSYTYWEGPNRYDAVPTRAMYESYLQISGDSLGTTALTSAKYITLSTDGSELYILDSGNSRILIVETDTFTLVEEITSISGEEDYNFKDAVGMYVSDDGTIYLADTEGERVLICDRYGNLLNKLECPTGIGVPSDLDYRPTRITMDQKGYLYVVCEGCYYGMLVYDTEYNFLGFHGSYVVEETLLNTIKGWVTGLFMTRDKSENTQKKLPAEIMDICVDTEGMLYTLSGTSTGQIKRLGLNGNQTLDHKFGFASASGDTINFGENPNAYWHKHYQYSLIFGGITVDPEGFIYAVDMGRSRVFVYDEECRMISAFATGFSEGNQVGSFVTPNAIACDGEKLYVLDFVLGSVTIFRLTDYGRLFKEADQLTMDGEYEMAQPLWEQALKMDANCQRAYEGIGKSLLNKGDYEGAMEYSKKGNDQQTYSQAYEVVQKAFLTRNFWWIFLLCLAAVGGIAALLVLSKKRKIFEIKNAKLRTALSVPFHPFQAFNSLKFQKNTSIPLAIIFILIFYLASVSEDLYGGFMYVITDTSNYNALYTLLGSVGVLLLWVIVNWGICILNEGKGSLKEVFTMSAYCMSPMVAYSVVFIVASHLIPATSTSTFGILSTIVAIYTVLLLLLGMTVVHEYSFFKAMGMALLTVICMLLAAFVIFSVTLLSQQFLVFFISVFNEIKLR